MVDEAEAAIIVHDMPYTFGCVGCHRTNLMLTYLVRRKKIPTLEVHYPHDEEEAKVMVTKIKAFLEGLK
jgi:putative methanogenesis marker protein 5